MKKHPKTNLEFIKKLSIFENLCSENIDDILALSTIFNVKKNKLLFFKDEEVKNFHIILYLLYNQNNLLLLYHRNYL